MGSRFDGIPQVYYGTDRHPIDKPIRCLFLSFSYVAILTACSGDVFTTQADIILDSGNNTSDTGRDSNTVSDADIVDSNKQDSEVTDSSTVIDSTDSSCLTVGSIPSSCFSTKATCQCQAGSCGSDYCCYLPSAPVNSLSCSSKVNIGSFGGTTCSTASCISHSWMTLCKSDKDCSGIEKCYSVETSDTGWEFGLCQ